MDRKTLKAETKINWPWIAAVKSDEQYTCSTRKVFCFSSLEMFSVFIAAALEQIAIVVVRLSLLVFLKADRECIVQNYLRFLICVNMSSMTYQFGKLAIESAEQMVFTAKDCMFK